MQVLVAEGWWQRLRGLACRDPQSVPHDRAMRFPRTRSIHTFGMRFALDLVWLDASGTPIRVDRAVPPRRHRGNRHAASVIECHAGQADALLAHLRSSP